MQSVWVDMMGEDDEWNPADQNKVEKAKYWLAQKSIDDNAAEAGIKEIISHRKKPKDKENPPSASDFNVDPNKQKEKDAKDAEKDLEKLEKEKQDKFNELFGFDKK